MQSYAVLVLVAFVVAVVTEEFYSSKWDDVDLRSIIENERILNKYVSCLESDTTTGCTQDVKDFKTILPNALQTTCVKCSPKQISRLNETIVLLCEKRPEIFSRILNKIDPTGEYRKAFEDTYGKFNGGC